MTISSKRIWTKILGIPNGARVRLLRRILPLADKGEKGTVMTSCQIRFLGKVYDVELDSGVHLLLKEDELEVIEEDEKNE